MLDLFAAKGCMLELLYGLVDLLSLAFDGAECGFPPRVHRKRHNESPSLFFLYVLVWEWTWWTALICYMSDGPFLLLHLCFGHLLALPACRRPEGVRSQRKADRQAQGWLEVIEPMLLRTWHDELPAFTPPPFRGAWVGIPDSSSSGCGKRPSCPSQRCP